MITKFSEYQNPNIKILSYDKEYDYGCLMLKTPMENWNKWLSIIDKEDIYNDESGTYGLEHEPHITILYGFLDSKEYDIKIDILKDIKKLKEVHFKIVDCSIFKNNDYDVLKFDISSDKLNSLNKYFRLNYEYENDYPDYHPHVTISYLIKNKADKYINKFKKYIDDKTLISDKWFYTSPNKYVIYKNV